MRIALIHGLRQSPPPIEAAFARLWPQASLRNIMDDSLSSDLSRDGGLTEPMTGRFLDLARYALGSGADAILFTCSAFGPCIDACKAALPDTPIRGPGEGMINEAARMGGKVGLIASFAPTLDSMPAEFPPTTAIITRLADGALQALERGDGEAHDRIVAEAAQALVDCDLIALAQFSIARAADAVARATGKPVLTTPDAAVRDLKRAMAAV